MGDLQVKNESLQPTVAELMATDIPMS